MTMDLGPKPQITRDPVCPSCGCPHATPQKSQGFVYEDAEGRRMRAQKQFRKCCECGTSFPTIRIRGEVERLKRRRG